MFEPQILSLTQIRVHQETAVEMGDRLWVVSSPGTFDMYVYFFFFLLERSIESTPLAAPSSLSRSRWKN